MSRCSILIVAGESSGDLHAAPVAAEIKSLLPDVHLFGAGGELMRAEGVELLAEVKDLAVMGFTGVPKVLPKLAGLKKKILGRFKDEQVPLAILVDYPGFNLNLAQSLKKLPRPPKILYYVAPQLWAWRENRVGKIQQYVDNLAVVFSFEVDFFRRYGIEAHFVGHPLLDEISEYINNPTTKHSPAPLIAFLPGSRPSVAKRHLPIVLESSALLKESISNVRIGIGRSPMIVDSFNWNEIEWQGLEIWDDARGLLANADVAGVCSGTATLETALLGVPQVVFYKTSIINYLIAKTFVKIPNVSLANLTAGHKIVVELLQSDLTAKRLSEEIVKMLTDEQTTKEILGGYEDVKRALGSPGAARRVAGLARELLGK